MSRKHVLVDALEESSHRIPLKCRVSGLLVRLRMNAEGIACVKMKLLCGG